MPTLTFSFTCIPDAAIWKPGISALAKCLFSALLAYKNRRTGICNPKLATLAERLGKSLRTIKRALAELYRAGMVIAHRNLWGNRYEIATPDQWQMPVSASAAEDSFVPNVAQAQVPNPAPHSCQTRHLEAATSLYEPDVIEPEGAAAAAARVSASPEEAASAATLDGCNEPQHPAPVAGLAEAGLLVAELMPQHPEPGNVPKAVAEARKLLTTRPEGIAGTVEVIRLNHGLWRARWAAYGPGRFIPQLWRWFHDGDWEHPPADRKEVQSETWIEKRKREQKESNESFYRTLAENGMWSALREYMNPDAVEAWREKIEAESELAS
jgi:hypothetical protein